MARCPICFGEGRFDMRDLDAGLAEHLTDAELALVGREGWMGFLDCDECETTGVVSEGRARDLAAVALAAVDQAIASVEDG